MNFKKNADGFAAFGGVSRVLNALLARFRGVCNRSNRERRQEGCIVVEMECASMLAVAKYRHIPFIQFLYGADNLSSDIWDMRDLALYGLTNAEKYMVLAFECGLAM